MPLNLKTASGGSVILTGANTASDKTITVPAADGNMLYADSSGNVGIGTSSPGAPLDVARGSGTAAYTSYRGNGNASAAEFFVGQGGDNYGYIYNRANGPIAFATNNITRALIDSSGNFLFNSGYGSVATAYGCRAWVNFNGTGTVAIRASGNVSSITDNGTGDYTVNFTTAMPDANYVVNVTVAGDGWVGSTRQQSTAPTISAVRIASFTGNGANNDSAFVNVSIFR